MILRSMTRILLLMVVGSWAKMMDEIIDQVVEELDPGLPASIALKDGDTFDYIVVGAGAAGAPAAARLALAGHHVLLVEAGGNPDLLSRIPGAAMSLLGSPLDWQYKTIPNNVSCLSSQESQCRFSRGKSLGGSSSINYMIYLRGHPRDYDDLGIPGWTWKDLEPYFLKYEGLQSLHKLPISSLPHHNTNGTMKVEFFGDSGNSWHSRLKEGFKFLNFPVNYDANAGTLVGVTQVLGYVYKGERMGTARGYLAREDVKKVLKVAKHTRCTGVIFSKRNTARGITVVQDLFKQKLRLYARREVVLSAGTIGTAQILMLSGIGPAEHLRSLGIRVRTNLPVGDNISDHALPLMMILVDPGPGVATPNVWVLETKGIQGLQWLASRKGPLASNGLTDVMAFANTRCYDFERRLLLHNRSDCDLPTFQLINAYIDRKLLQSFAPIVQRFTGLKDNIVQQFKAANKEQAIIVASPVVLQPYSRGSIRLASANPEDTPAIFPNFLSDERDLDEMVRGIKILEHLVETPLFKEEHASLLRLKLPGCEEYGGEGERYWRCYCRHMTYSVYHAVGSAALGSVLDGELRVRGVRRLRVADLSVLPRLPRANTAAVAIAIGERVADFILVDNYPHGS